MMGNCLDEGVIQAFLDGELAADTVETVTRHVALCDDCAVLLTEAEDESALVYSALEQEFDSLVPTHRLWTKINSSIEEEKRSNSLWQRFLLGVSDLGLQLSRPSVAAFASLLLVISVFSSLWILRPIPLNSEVAVDTSPGGFTEVDFGTPALPSADTASTAPQTTGAGAQNTDAPETPPVKTARQTEYASFNRESAENRPVRTSRKADSSAIADREAEGDVRPPTASKLNYVPGEESYVKTIAALNTSVDAGKDVNLKPSERFAFEKDMAVIDDAISKMKAEIRKNPNNEAAKQVLLASYQNKIDLLNSVSERNDLIASIR